MTHYIIYKTINLINDKIYIGKHQTNNINDSYIGSGKALKLAIQKYGKENFKKEILFVFDNEKEMKEKEIELVNREFCLRDDTYNIYEGGHGSFAHIIHDEIWKRKVKDTLLKNYKVENPMHIPSVIEHIREKTKERWEKGLFQPHTEKTKKKLSDLGKLQKGKKICITNGNDNKMINKNSEIPLGWKQGNTIKNHRTRNKILISDENSTKFINVGDKIPEGWKKGGTSNSKIGITDGTENKFIPSTNLIPEGWKKGFTLNKKIIT